MEITELKEQIKTGNMREETRDSETPILRANKLYDMLTREALQIGDIEEELRVSRRTAYRTLRRINDKIKRYRQGYNVFYVSKKALQK